MERPGIVDEVVAWYAENARELPWRGPDVTPWQVLVSEIMLQQTPVSRVLGPWRDWIERWPTPAALATEPVGEAIRQWGRLGYPRRAQRLHTAALRIVEQHHGTVPGDLATLRALPGVGAYTAAAVATFAFRQRQVVLDVNVRRVLARLDSGRQHPRPGSPTRDEIARAEAWLPTDDAVAATWSVAVMELGAQLCRAVRPNCPACPVARHCRWLAEGQPSDPAGRRPLQGYEGTDRQARGVVLAHLRRLAPDVVVAPDRLIVGLTDAEQARRAVRSLVADGLIQAVKGGYRL